MAIEGERNQEQMLMAFEDREYWKAIVLYGLNTATYKMGLGQVLVGSAIDGVARLTWDDLSSRFLRVYRERLRTGDPMPQQGDPSRLTVLERCVRDLEADRIGESEAVARVADRGLRDVVPRFQTIAGKGDLVEGRFYRFVYGRELVLTDAFLALAQVEASSLSTELDARWSLLEGAFDMRHHDWDLANDIREVYLESSSVRKPLTPHVPFLRGYQADRCFYCGELIPERAAHVDHLLPRQVLGHDEVWNLVLAHDVCNLLKSDLLVPEVYIEKLVQRNENLVGSSHPWRKEILQALGGTPRARRIRVREHYRNVEVVLGPRKWGGAPGFRPEHDPFFRELVTRLSNG